MGTHLTPINPFFFFPLLLSLISVLSFIFILISCLSHGDLFLIVPAFALFTSSLCPLSTDQRLDLNKLSPNDSDTVRGQIVGEYTPRVAFGGGGGSGVNERYSLLRCSETV